MESFVEKIRNKLFFVTGLFYVFFITKQFFSPDPPMLVVPIHVFLTISIVFLIFPISVKSKNQIFYQLIDFSAYAFFCF